jgi:tetratricopeptide (TPR) repeat protein
MRTNLINLCTRLSRGKVAPEDLKDAGDSSLVETAFNLLGATKALLVFDNVDEYIDLVDLTASGLVKLVIEEAFKRPHAARVIFTCRPNVSFVAPHLLQLPIEGFSQSDCVVLFRKYKTALEPSVLEALAIRARTLTDGHPFWINIIAAQAVVSLAAAETFMDDLERSDISSSASQSDALARQMPSVVWQRLSERQRILLRGMAEGVCEENKEQLAKILKKELTYNAVEKGLTRLRQLNLVVVKSADTAREYFDLHPLVRRFVRHRGSRDQRNKYIAMFVAYFEGVIKTLSPNLEAHASFSNLRNWSYKIELEVNRSNFEAAIATLHDANLKLEEAGYLEEYVRVGELVFDKADWSICASIKHFDLEVCSLVDALSQLGRYSEADRYLDRLRSTVGTSGISFLRLCEAATMRHWRADEFEAAIPHGRAGVELKARSGADIDVDRRTLPIAGRTVCRVSFLQICSKYLDNNEPSACSKDADVDRADRGGGARSVNSSDKRGNRTSEAIARRVSLMRPAKYLPLTFPSE